NLQLSSLNSQILKEKSLGHPDRDRLSRLSADLDKARVDFEAFETSLFVAHPELRVQRGRVQPANLAECGALIADSRTALIEFSASDSEVLLFLLDKDDRTSTARAKVYKLQTTGKQLKEAVDHFRDLLATRDIGFATDASRLYDLLLKPAAA